MSGIAKGIKKVFKKVGKFVKKVAPIALIAGAAFFTGGFGLLGGAGVGGAGLLTAGKAAISGQAAGGLGSWVTGLFSDGGGAMAVGSMISGAAGAYSAAKLQEAEEQSIIDGENRLKESYEGAGAAASFRQPSNGLGSDPTPTPMAAPAAPISTPTPTTARPSVTATSTAAPAKPRIYYDRDLRTIVYT